MSATYLIDGYNLLHAMGVLGPGRAGPHGLEKARLRLLGLLHATFGAEAGAVTVVFDAAGAPPGADAEQEHRGIGIVFALGKQQADDVIEALIRKASAPKSLHVVSDDHRIQKAARRRQCVAMGCEAFLAWLDRRRRESRAAATEVPEKREGCSEEEAARWAAEFGDVEQDPTLRRAFEQFGFEE